MTENKFIDFVPCASGDIYLASLSGGSIFVEKFNSTGKSIGTLKAPYNYEKNNEERCHLCVNEKNSDKVGLVMNYDIKKTGGGSSVYSFDFASKKYLRSADILYDKFYAEQLNTISNKLNGGVQRYEYVMYYFRPEFIFFNNNKLNLISDAKWYDMDMQGKHTMWNSYGIEAVQYDSLMKVSDHLVLPRNYRQETIDKSGASMGFYRDGNKLRILSTSNNNVQGAGNFALYTVFNLDTYTSERNETLVTDGTRMRSIDGASTFFFKNNFVLCGSRNIMNLSSDVNAIIRKVDY